MFLKILNKYIFLKRRKVIGNQGSFIYEHFQKAKTVFMEISGAAMHSMSKNAVWGLGEIFKNSKRSLKIDGISIKQFNFCLYFDAGWGLVYVNKWISQRFSYTKNISVKNLYKYSLFWCSSASTLKKSCLKTRHDLLHIQSIHQI